MKRKIEKSILFLAMFICIESVVSTTIYASSNKTKAIEEYNKILSNEKIQWTDMNGGIEVLASDCKFSIIYIDNDSIPELVIYSPNTPGMMEGGNIKAYTYKDGKLILISSSTNEFYYYKKKGIFMDRLTHQGQYDSYYRLKKGKALLKYSQVQYSNGMDGFYKGTFTDENNKISSKQFKNGIINLTGETKKRGVKYVKNTKRNREKYLG